MRGCKLPSHLYIRVDRELRSALVDGAQAAGETVSAFVRRQLRMAVGPARYATMPSSTSTLRAGTDRGNA
jgi:hypothetical protein